MPGCIVQFRLFTAIAIAITTSLGCSGSDGRCAVAGRVTLDDAPLQEGRIAFNPKPGTPGRSVGAEIVAGNYHLDRAQGPTPGEYQVTITAVRKTGKKIPDEMRPGPNNLVDEIEPIKFDLSTEQKATIAPGDNTETNFSLKSVK